MSQDPNFPKGLDIKPLDASKTGFSPLTSFDEEFDHQAQKDAIATYGIAGRVWEASYPMIMYLDPPPSWSFDPPVNLREKNRKPYSILELGSGTGIVASCISQALREGDRLIATDLPEVCPLLETNLSKHLDKPASLAVRSLSWGNIEHSQAIREEFEPLGLTHVICSDLVYFPELLAPLLRSLIHVTSKGFSHPDEDPTVVISYMIRSLTKEAPFWSAFGLWFSFYPVSYLPPQGSSNGSPHDSDEEEPEWRRFGSGQDDQVFVFIAKRRSGSWSWEVPEDDQDLLGGVGANGTKGPKSDDTFESLLLLSME